MGLRKRVYPHLMRHTFATWAPTRGMNPLTMAQILGHNSLAMIQNVYAHLTPSDSYEALLKALSGRGRSAAQAALMTISSSLRPAS